MAKNVRFNPDGNVYGDDFNLVPAGTVVTGNGQTAARPVGYSHTLRAALAVTAASGTTPSMTVVLEHAPASSGPWTTLTTFTAATGATSERKVVSGLDRFARARWTVTGTTPSFTFGVSGELVGGENND